MYKIPQNHGWVDEIGLSLERYLLLKISVLEKYQ